MKARVTGLVVLVAVLSGCGGPGGKLQDYLTLPFPSEAQTEAKSDATAPTNGAAGAATETGSLSVKLGPHQPQEASALVSGTPTGVFADVARGALGCWFAADGPLKATHVYRAEAQPPAKGGDAEIVIHERDAAVRDLRGPRAYRISFAAELSSVRVTMLSTRFEPKLTQAMTKDVESWAKGGGGCEMGALLARPPPVPKIARQSTKTAKGQPSIKAEAKGGTKPR
jgi:hypothetical protein